MVKIIIVSHSKKIADGICELASEMAADNNILVSAGGMEDGSLGTDALLIKETILKANNPDGVVVLADLGSGVLSGQMAIEMAQEEGVRKVKIADAPILEGAISATVVAAAGATFEEVVEAAEMAATNKKL